MRGFMGCAALRGRAGGGVPPVLDYFNIYPSASRRQMNDADGSSGMRIRGSRTSARVRTARCSSPPLRECAGAFNNSRSGRVGSGRGGAGRVEPHVFKRLRNPFLNIPRPGDFKGFGHRLEHREVRRHGRARMLRHVRNPALKFPPVPGRGCALEIHLSPMRREQPRQGGRQTCLSTAGRPGGRQGFTLQEFEVEAACLQEP